MKSITFTILERFDSVQTIKTQIKTKTKEELIHWALDCLKPLFMMVPLTEEAQAIFKEVDTYQTTQIPVQKGRQLALRIHAMARQETEPSRIFTYRALGHSVAIIHVNSHAYGMVLYSLKAYYELGYSLEQLAEISREYQKRLG